MTAQDRHRAILALAHSLRPGCRLSDRQIRERLAAMVRLIERQRSTTTGERR